MNFFEFQFIYFNFWQQFYLLVIQQLNWDLKILKWILGDAHPCCRAVELFLQWLLVLCDDQWLFLQIILRPIIDVLQLRNAP